MTGREKTFSGGSRERGVALLAVLWLSVALTMIAMTTAYLVRSEATAVGNQMAAARAEYLARGGVNAAVYAILRSGVTGTAATSGGSGEMPLYQPGQRILQFRFQEGSARVEIVPENAKLNINVAPSEQLAALFTLLGESPDRSAELAAAIVEWRSPRTSGAPTPLDSFYEGLAQPYTARHAPFAELEEMLAVRGMSRDLFFGRSVESADGKRMSTPPLSDLLTTDPSVGGINVNYASDEVLRVLPGWNDSLVLAVIQARAAAPLTTLQSVPGLSAAAGVNAVTLTPGVSYTITATGVPGDLPISRTVSHTTRARIVLDGSAAMGYRVTGWWQDWPWSSSAGSPAETGSVGGLANGGFGA